MEFLNYPFDIQVCEFFLGSTWHHSKIMTYSLKRKKIKMYTSEGSNADSVHAADTNLQYHIQLEPLEKNVTSSDDTFDSNITFAVVGFSLKLRRYYIQYVLSYYIPSMLFVMASWISFVIPPEAIPGRMAMLITLLLVSINLFDTIIRIQPASRTTLLSIWTLVCTFFVTAALFAYAILLWKKWCQNTPRGTKNSNTVKPVPTLEAENWGTKDGTMQDAEPDNANEGSWDKNCLITFSVTFFIFNSIYWPAVVGQHLTMK